MLRLPGIMRGLITTALLLIGAGAGIQAQTPTNLRVDGVANNRHVLSFTPTFCWDFTGNQTNWQIQVDDDPNFTLNLHQATPQVWFWDSGQQDKGTANDDRCAQLRAITMSGFVPISVDRRAGSIYWRLRLAVSGSWGPWSAATLRMNQYPLMPEDVAAQSDTAPSSDPVDPIPAKLTGRTLYVAPNGNDASPGTQASPFRTIGFATKALVKGDTLLVRGGIYNENVYISAPTGYASGEPNNPITVKAYPGETPVIRAIASGTRTALTIEGPNIRLSDWVFDGLTIGGSSATTGILISGAKSVTVTNCRFENTVTVNTLGMVIAFNSEDIRIVGNLFDQPLFDQIELGAARHVEIRNNEFTRFHSRHCIHAHGGSANNILIADNYFHDGAPYEGVIFLYLGTQGTRIVNNVFANVWKRDPSDPSSDTGLAYGVLIVRSGETTVENNVFYNLEDYGILLNEFSSFGTYRNNIFMKCAVGLRFRGGVAIGSSTSGAIADYNLFYQNGDDLVYGVSELGYFAHPPTGNCLGGPLPSNPLCDPKFVSPTTKDFRLQAGSAAIDAGDPLSPVPEAGGSRRDIGRFESGVASTPPYEYQSRFTVSDSTPRFTWSIVDVDNLLEAMFDDLPPGDTDFQTKLQVQVDPRPTFDSLSQGRPMLDSGVITSTIEGYTIPDTRALPAGEYYVRVRQWDDHDFTKGQWSDHNLRFRVSGEPAPPYVSSPVPAAGAVGVAQTATITLHVKDDGVGVSQATIRLFVNGVQVAPVITGGGNDFILTFIPSTPFAAGSTVTVRVVAQDLNNSPPGLDTSYSFSIRDTTPPLPPANVRISL